MSLEKVPNIFLNFSQCDMDGEEKPEYRFKSFRLNVEERQLSENGIPVSLTPKAFDVLVALVERNGHLVTKNELLNLIWADSFVEEINVARIIHTLRKILGEDGNGNKFIETVPKQGYRFVAEVEEISEPTATAEDFSNESFPTEKNISRNRPDKERIYEFSQTNLETSDSFVKPKTRIILFTVGFLTAVFLLFLLSFNFRSETANNPNAVKTIAVLPVNPVSSEKRDELYEIGIADSLIYKIGAMKGLIVRPLSATRKYSSVEQDPLAAGKEQQVEFVLASNYQIADGKIRITAQLFNVANGKIEETYKTEKDAGNIFALQDTIAGEIGKLLQTRFALTPNPTTARRGTNNEEAYRLYLQGKYLTMNRNKEAQKKAIECFEQAIKLDPNFALAYARMAFAYYSLNLNDNNFTNAGKVREFVKQALDLDPNLAEAYASRGFVNSLYDWNFPTAEKDYLRAIELEPNNDTAHWLYAMLLSHRGRVDEAMTEIETAQAIDPGAVLYMVHRGRILYYAGRNEEAIAQYNQAIDLDERFTQPYGWLVRAYELKGDYDTAYQYFLKREERSPRKDQIENYKKAYVTTGWLGVRQNLSESIENNFFDLARLYALRGEKDAAFEYLNKALEKRQWLMVSLKVEPAFDNLRDDPRFGELLKRTGLE